MDSENAALQTHDWPGMKERLLTGLLLAAAVLVYGNTLVNRFAMDDELYIMRNAQVTDPSLHGLFSPNPVSTVFRPVAFATLALNWALSGTESLSYHLMNLLLHAGATWLLYILLQELLGSSSEGKTAAFAAALLFAVHPIHTEAVAWAGGSRGTAGRRVSFCGLDFAFARPPHRVAGCALRWRCFRRNPPWRFCRSCCLGDYALGKWKPGFRYALFAGLTVSVSRPAMDRAGRPIRAGRNPGV
jgi:hypothetical protein